jgi:hypothetical protein
VSDLSNVYPTYRKGFSGFQPSRVNWLRFIGDWGVQFDMPVALAIWWWRCAGLVARDYGQVHGSPQHFGRIIGRLAHRGASSRF